MSYKLRPAWSRYGVSVACIFLAWLAREALTPVLGPGALPFITMFPAVVITAWYGGLGAGVFATTLSALVVNWAFILPVHTWSSIDAADYKVVFFLIACGFILGAMQAMHRSTARSLNELVARQQAERQNLIEAQGARRLLELGNHCSRLGDDFDECLAAILDVAIELTGADKGALQLVDPKTGALVLAAHRGFNTRFLEFFASVHDETAAVSGAAMRSKQRVIVEDITRSEILANQPAHDVLLEAGVRAVQSTPLVSSRGKIVGMISTHYTSPHCPTERELRFADLLSRQSADYVERKQAEEALRRSEAVLNKELRAMARLQELSAHLVQQGELKPLLQAILAAAADLTGTDKGNIQIYDADTGMLRMVVHQGLGQKLVEHFAEDGWVATCAQAASKGERVVVEDVENLEHLRGTVELDIVLNDGIRSIQSTPLIGRDGRLLGMLNNHYRDRGRPDDQNLRYIDLLARQAADLIERDHGEAALRESEQRFRQLLELLPVGVYTIKAPNGKITYYNDQAAVLWGHRPAVGDTEDRWCGSFRLWMPDGSPLPHDHTPMTQVLAEGRSFRNLHVMIERPPPDSSRITVLVNIDPIVDDAGRVVGAINVFQDVTVLHETEEALRQALKAKDHFLASISHELRTPLTPVVVMTDILQRNKTLPQPVKSAVDVIARNVQLEAKLVNDLLDLSRANTGKLRVERRECDIHEVVEGAVRVCSGPSKAKQLNIVTKLNATHRKFSGDATRLQQVFWNLIQNAIKFSSRGGSIMISSRNENGQLCVDVSDSGCGIEPANLERIFEPFTEDKRATNGNGRREGLGLGLSIARSIVVAHGGTLVAASDGISRGATFTVSLPAPDWTTNLAPQPDTRSAEKAQPLLTKTHVHASSSCDLAS